MLLSKKQVIEEIKEEIKKYLETNENGNIMIEIYATERKQFKEASLQQYKLT